MFEIRQPVSRRQLLKAAAASTAAVPAVQLLSACGGGDSGGTGDLTYISGPSNDKDQQYKDALAKAFTKEHEDITVKSTFYDFETVDADLTAAYSGDDPPDIAYLVTRVWPQFADSGALLDVSDRVSEASFKSTYDAIPDEVWAGITRDGKMWGVPYLGAVFPLYINKTLLEDAGVEDWSSSYEAMLDAARAVSGGDVYGFSIGQTLQEEAFHDIGAYIHNAGGDLLTEDGTQGNLDLPDVADALDLLGRFHSEGLTPKPGLYDGEGKEALFRNGRIGIAHGSVGLVAALESEEVDFDWDVALVPPGPVAQTAYGDFGFLCIAAGSDDQDAAWEYVEYLASPDPVVEYVTDIGRFLQAVRTDVADQIFPEGDSPQKTLQTEFVPIVQPYATFPGQLEALRGLVSEYELVIRGDKSGAEAAAAANDRVNQLLA